MQAVKVKRNWNALASWNEYRSTMMFWANDWTVPGILQHWQVDQCTTNDDFEATGLLEMNEGDWYYFIPTNGVQSSIPLSTAGVDWMTLMAENPGTGALNGILLWDSKIEHFNLTYGGVVDGQIRYYSEDTGNSQGVQFSVVYDHVEYGDAEDEMVQEEGSVEFNDWVEIYKKIVYWELELDSLEENNMLEILLNQKKIVRRL